MQPGPVPGMWPKFSAEAVSILSRSYYPMLDILETLNLSGRSTEFYDESEPLIQLFTTGYYDSLPTLATTSAKSTTFSYRTLSDVAFVHPLPRPAIVSGDSPSTAVTTLFSCFHAGTGTPHAARPSAAAPCVVTPGAHRGQRQGWLMSMQGWARLHSEGAPTGRASSPAAELPDATAPQICAISSRWKPSVERSSILLLA